MTFQSLIQHRISSVHTFQEWNVTLGQEMDTPELQMWRRLVASWLPETLEPTLA